MMPVIRISEDVMDMLKKFAVPLEDTPDSVLRRILGDYAHLKQAEEWGNRVPSKVKDDLHPTLSKSCLVLHILDLTPHRVMCLVLNFLDPTLNGALDGLLLH